MLFCRLRLGSPRGLYPSGLLNKFLYTFLFCLVSASVFISVLSANYDHNIGPDIFKPGVFSSLYFPGQTNAKNFLTGHLMQQ